MTDDATPAPAAERRHPSGWGYIPDLPDFRDVEHSFTAKLRAVFPVEAPPPVSDMRAEMPPHYDQGMHGSCVWQSVAAVIERLRDQMKAPSEWTPSRLMGYYETRKIEGTIPLDNGCQIRNAIKVAVKVGVCPEKHWPYVTDAPDQIADSRTWVYPKSSRAVREPTRTAYRSATLYQAIKYRRVDSSSLQEMLVALGSSRLPIIIGFTCYAMSLYDSAGWPRPVVALPAKGDVSLGGHAVVVIGYNNTAEPLDLGNGFSLPPKHFLCRNSWSDKVQMGGDFAIPFAYLTNLDLASDAWIVDGVER